MFELFLSKVTTESIEADEHIEIVPAPVPADDDRYSNEMCPQPVELILDVMSGMFDPKRKRRCVKKRPLVPRRVLPAMSRPRERRAAPRRDGGGDGSSASGDDGRGGEPPPHPKSEHSPRGKANPPQSVLRAPRVLDGRAQQ